MVEIKILKHFKYLYNLKAASVSICLYIRKNDPFPITQFQIWGQISNPLAKAEVLSLFGAWSDHNQKFF